MQTQNRRAKEEYAKKLSHPKWRAKREEVLHHYGQKCSICGSIRDLNVHHKSYKNGNEPWEYPIENFQVLCDRDHAKIHGITEQEKVCINPSCDAVIRSCYVRCFQCQVNIGREYEQAIAQKKRVIEQQEREGQTLIDTIRALELEVKEAKQQTASSKGQANARRMIEEQDRSLLKLINQQQESIKKQQASIRDFQKSLEQRDRMIEDLRNRASEPGADVNQSNEIARELASDKEKVDKLLGATNAKMVKLEETRKENDVLKRQLEEEDKMKKILIVLVSLILVIVSYPILTDLGTKDQPAGVVRDVAPNLVVQPVAGPVAGPVAQSPVLFSLSDAASSIGEYIETQATVYQVNELKDGTVFINLGGRYPTQLLALTIFARTKDKIDQLPNEGDRIRISGVISEYKGAPRIIINSAAQMHILD